MAFWGVLWKDVISHEVKNVILSGYCFRFQGLFFGHQRKLLRHCTILRSRLGELAATRSRPSPRKEPRCTTPSSKQANPSRDVSQSVQGLEVWIQGRKERKEGRKEGKKCDGMILPQ